MRRMMFLNIESIWHSIRSENWKEIAMTSLRAVESVFSAWRFKSSVNAVPKQRCGLIYQSISFKQERSFNIMSPIFGVVIFLKLKFSFCVVTSDWFVSWCLTSVFTLRRTMVATDQGQAFPRKTQKWTRNKNRKQWIKIKSGIRNTL